MFCFPTWKRIFNVVEINSTIQGDKLLCVLESLNVKYFGIHLSKMKISVMNSRLMNLMARFWESRKINISGHRVNPLYKHCTKPFTIMFKTFRIDSWYYHNFSYYNTLKEFCQNKNSIKSKLGVIIFFNVTSFK